jgi:hypothetical protein
MRSNPTHYYPLDLSEDPEVFLQLLPGEEGTED